MSKCITTMEAKPNTPCQMDEETLEELFCVLMRVKEGVLAGTVRWPDWSESDKVTRVSEEDLEEDERDSGKGPTEDSGEDTEATEPEEWDKDPTTFFSRKLQNPRRQRL